MLNINLKQLVAKKPVTLQADPDILKWISQNSAPLTPDLWKLQQYSRQLIFVACDMKIGGRHNNLVAEGSWVPKPVYPVCYTHHKYTFWKKDLGRESYPIILPESYRPTGFVRWPVEPARIRGELWAIEPNSFISLDNHRQNTLQFRRERVKITLPYRHVCFEPSKPLPHITEAFCNTVTAWVYFGIPDYWDAMIGGIFTTSQMETQEHWGRIGIKKYYEFENN